MSANEHIAKIAALPRVEILLFLVLLKKIKKVVQ